MELTIWSFLAKQLWSCGRYEDSEPIENSTAVLLCQSCHIYRPEFMENASVVDVDLCNIDVT